MDLLTDSKTYDVCLRTIDAGSFSLSDIQPSISDCITDTDNQRNNNDIINTTLPTYVSFRQIILVP